MAATDPAALGLAFEPVTVPAPVGDCPAWLIPGNDSTWVLAVHGRGADRREALRVLPALSRLGHPVLCLTYRNDVEAPAGPDGYYHLGDTEWADVAAAVGYARTRGAREVVLYGWSMGAAIIAAYLSRGASCACPVRAMVWDSPVVDWAATLRQQARIRRLPPGLVWTAMRLTSVRAGIDFSRFHLARRPPSVRPPTLLLHGTGDSMVPVAASRRLARAADRLDWSIRYVEFPAAEHTALWNADPARYESEVAQFLAERVSAAGSRPGPARSARR
jgi:alpha-beta hydrolase superfamily lysophospholipase